MKVLRKILRMSLGGVFQVSASSQSEELSPQMDQSTEPMNLGMGDELFHRQDESTGQCGMERERRQQRKSPLGMGWDGIFPTLVYNEPLKLKGRQLSHRQDGRR